MREGNLEKWAIKHLIQFQVKNKASDLRTWRNAAIIADVVRPPVVVSKHFQYTLSNRWACGGCIRNNRFLIRNIIHANIKTPKSLFMLSNNDDTC